MSERAEIGIIGGSGLYEMEGFTDVREVPVQTPFGDPRTPDGGRRWKAGGSLSFRATPAVTACCRAS